MDSGAVKRERRESFEREFGTRHNCFFCEKRVSGEYDIHHKDGDHDRDLPENWAAAHGSCHRSYHAKGNKHRAGKKLTPEHKAAISLANKGNSHTKGRTLTPEHRAKISASLRGKSKSAEARVNMKAARHARLITQEVI